MTSLFTRKLLVIDDDLAFLELVVSMLEGEGITVLTAGDAEQGIAMFESECPQVVLVDLVMPKMNGMEVLERILAIAPHADVLITTGHYSTESAVEAIKKGAADYMNKPIALDALRKRLRSLIGDAESRGSTLELDHELLGKFQFEGIIGRSPLILDVFGLIRRVAPHFRTVLLAGATGTGKELAARALHRLSPVAQQRFVVCNCAALVDTLFESELFGHVRGAFTGAVSDREGLFEYANHGTIMLDEVGELPLTSQAKLLRVLQNQEIQRVGSPVMRSIDVRVIAATNRNLLAMVQEGKFREDLYYRLSMVKIDLPTLNERREDFPLLERHFVNLFANRYGKNLRGIARRAQAAIRKYHWPGNIRELENVIGNAAMLCSTDLIDLNDLPEHVRSARSTMTDPPDELLPVDEVVRRHAIRVLDNLGGDKTRAAKVLGISRTTLYQLIARKPKPNEPSRFDKVDDLARAVPS